MEPPAVQAPESAPPPMQRSPTTRKTIISRMTQFQPKHATASIVPYAPERLSISHDMAPSMAQAFTHAGIPRERIQSVSTLREETPTNTNTMFAALRMRRALHRSRGPRPTEAAVVKDETQVIQQRHQKVLSRYKIRKITVEDEDANQLRNLPLLMVNPQSNLYKLWQLVTLIFIIYQSLALPFTLAFMSSSSGDSSALDICMTSVFAFDIVIQFNTPLQIDKDSNEYSTDRWLIARTYSKGWLFFDVLACIPFDSVMVWVNSVDSKSGNLNVLGLLKALRIPRLLRLIRLLRVMKLLKLRPELQRWLQYSRHANLFRLVRLVVSFLVINHYLACIWYGLVASDENKAQDASKSSSHLYFSSLYTCLLVVMGQNITIYDDSEYLFCILVMVIGAVIMAVVFGNVAILIANYYESQSSHQKKMEWLFASMNRMKLPFELQNRINDYYQAMWERHGTLDGAVAAFIPELSRNLAYEVELFLRMDMINRAPIFQNCSAKVVQELVMELELQVFMPGDYIVVRGEVGNDMYFVQSGICEVTKDVGLQRGQTLGNINVGSTEAANDSETPSYEIVLKTLGQGDYFGEIALLMNCKRTANVRAQVFSELCTLTREVFESISMRYLEDRNIIEKFIMDKYDPNMLQAAMKQSQEVSMRTAAAASSVLKRPITATPTPHDEDRFSSAKLNGLLNKIYDRIVKLENRIESDAKERRDSDIRQRIDSVARPHPAMLHRVLSSSADTTVAFEPDRVSQRHLLDDGTTSSGKKNPSRTPSEQESSHGEPQIRRSNPNTSMLPNHSLISPHQDSERRAGGLPGSIERGPSSSASMVSDTTAGADIDGIATPQGADAMKSWRRPALSRPGSWRNSHSREGSMESVRLRGLVRPHPTSPHSGSIVRHSSRAPSINEVAAATEVLPAHHSLLRNEPEVRQHLDAIHGCEHKEAITNDMLDELAERLSSRTG